MDVIVFWIVLGICIPVVGSVNATAHKEILEKLTYPVYDSSIRPMSNGQPVEVSVDVVLNSVGPVNNMEMTWTASFYLRQEWKEPRLIIQNVDSLVKLDGQHVYRLWLPDMFFSNNKEGHKHDLTVENHLIYLNVSTGVVLYSQRLTVVLNCEMDLHKFPHDSQECDIKMESYSFTTDDLVFQWSSSRAATSLLPTAFIPDFEITQVKTTDCTTTYAIGTFPCLMATVHLERQIGFYVFQTYLPSILIVILSWASFWIDHEAVPARISVGLLTVLTITTQLSGSRDQLPRVPYIKAIDVWMFINLVFVFAAYMEYAVVTVLSRGWKKKKFKKAAQAEQQAKEAQEAQELAAIQLSVHGTNMANGSFSTCTPRRTTGTPPPPTPPPNLDSSDAGRRVDKRSRWFFPLCFAIFNLVYWTSYLVAL